MRAVRTSLAALAVLCALAGTSEARSRAPHLSWVKCASKCTDARTVAPGGIATMVDIARPTADYTYVTRQRFYTNDLLLEGFGYTKSANTLTETFLLAFACK